MEGTELKVTPRMHQFIDKLGLYYESFGIPRIGGRIVGLIHVVKEPISAEQMTATLQVSRSSISTNIRLLLSAGLVDISRKPHDRTDYFQLADDVWEKAILLRIRGYQDLMKIVDQGIQACEEEGPGSDGKLRQMAQWTELMLNMHEDALKRLENQSSR